MTSRASGSDVPPVQSAEDGAPTDENATQPSQSAIDDRDTLEDARFGKVDRYVRIHNIAEWDGVKTYDARGSAGDYYVLNLTEGLEGQDVDPSHAAVLPLHDQGEDLQGRFLVYERYDAVPLCAGPYLAWDPHRLDVIRFLVGALRSLRDEGLRLLHCRYETLLVTPTWEVQFMSPAASGENLEEFYIQALRDIIPQMVMHNFARASDEQDAIVHDAPTGGNPIIWSTRFHGTPEVRTLLHDVVSERLTQLDDVQRAIDSFGLSSIVRKRTGWGTHRGLVRDANEDALVVLEQTMVAGSRPVRLELYAVADGMGGHEAGEIASEITLKSMATEVLGGLNITAANELGRDIFDHGFLSERMVAAIDKTNATVRQYAWDAHSASVRKPGSTLVCVLALGAVLTLAHVGDSRAYKIREDGTIERATRDHSPVQKLVDRRKLTPEEAFFHPQRHQISSNIGIAPEHLQRDVSARFLREGEGLLLCSDGLSDMLTDADLESYCLHERDPRRLARTLVEAACERGGRDNVTVIVVMRAPGGAQEQRETPPKVS